MCPSEQQSAQRSPFLFFLSGHTSKAGLNQEADHACKLPSKNRESLIKSTARSALARLSSFLHTSKAGLNQESGASLQEIEH